MENFSYCHVAERTDVGCKRKANEDNLVHFESQNGLVATVCDGMGGHVGGAVASQTAVDAIRECLTTTFFQDPREAIGVAIDAANRAILERARRQPELTGMGSTCVMLIVREGKVYIGSVGDSRVYIVRDRRIRQLTKDQSFVQMLVDSGQITAEQAEHHPRKNEITNCLGIDSMKPATVLPEPIEPQAGDCFLLCSDGLSGMVSDEHILRVVSRQAEMTSQQRVDTLVEMARANGGLDNITVQIVEFSVAPAVATGKCSGLRINKWWFAVALTAVAAALIAWLITFLVMRGDKVTPVAEPAPADSAAVVKNNAPATLPLDQQAQPEPTPADPVAETPKDNAPKDKGNASDKTDNVRRPNILDNLFGTSSSKVSQKSPAPVSKDAATAQPDTTKKAVAAQSAEASQEQSQKDNKEEGAKADSQNEEKKESVESSANETGKQAEEQSPEQKLAADKNAFEEYKAEKQNELRQRRNACHDRTCRKAVDKSLDELQSLDYDEAKTLEQNKAAADAIVENLTKLIG